MTKNMTREEAIRYVKENLCTNCGIFLGGGKCKDDCMVNECINALSTKMLSVECISPRISFPDQIQVHQKYLLDINSISGDIDGDWYGEIYTLENKKIAQLNLKHFKEI